MNERMKSCLLLKAAPSARQRALLLAVGAFAAACGGTDAAAESMTASAAATSGDGDAAKQATAAQAASAGAGSGKNSAAAGSGNSAVPSSLGATAGATGAASPSTPSGAANPSTPSGAANTSTPSGAANPSTPSGAAGTSGASAPSAGNAASAAAGGGGASAPNAAAAGAAGAPTPWQWPMGKPEDFGIETTWLDDAADSIQRSTGNRYGMVVVRKGTLVYEKYWDGTADDQHIIYSCTKSWGSSLIGMAVTQGLLTVKDEVRKWVPMPAQGVSEGATLEHVLTQSAHTTPPGQSFQYNSGYLLNTAPEVLGAAISSMGMTPHDFFLKNLAEPLGLAMTWPECPKGGCAGTRYQEGFIQFGNEPPEAPNKDLPLSSVRDQAKLGWLWANNGKWDDKQLIDPAYIQAGSKPGPGFRSMYGYLMWLQNDEQFGAIGGVGNCYVNIMPSKQLVIAVMGNDTGLGQGGGWADFRSLANRIPD